MDPDVSCHVTIVVKTDVCDASIVRQVGGLVRSFHGSYKTVRILLTNDVPGVKSMMLCVLVDVLHSVPVARTDEPRRTP